MELLIYYIKGVTIDLSSLYSGNINKVFRIVAFNKANDLFVNDKITTNNKSADIKWMIVTPAEAKIVSTNEIELTSNGHKMLLSIDSLIDIKVNTWNNNPFMVMIKKILRLAVLDILQHYHQIMYIK